MLRAHQRDTDLKKPLPPHYGFLVLLVAELFCVYRFAVAHTQLCHHRTITL